MCSYQVLKKFKMLFVSRSMVKYVWCHIPELGIFNVIAVSQFYADFDIMGGGRHLHVRVVWKNYPCCQDVIDR